MQRDAGWVTGVGAGFGYVEDMWVFYCVEIAGRRGKISYS